MEQGGRANEMGLLLQGGTPRQLGVLQLVNGGEMAVDEGGIGERRAEPRRCSAGWSSGE
jgi:hypothetical protein